MKFPLSASRRWAVRLTLLSALTSAIPVITVAAEPVAKSGITAELFYEILLGEMNIRQGEAASGFSLLLDAARKTNDVQLYERAVNIALQARSGDAALLAARAWSQAWPQDRKANFHVLQILLALNQVDDSLSPLQKELALAPSDELADSLNAIPMQYARISDKKQATRVVQEAVAPFLGSSQTQIAAVAWTTMGRMHIASEDFASALAAAQKGQAIDEQASGPTLLALELMQRKIKEAEPLVQHALQKQSSAELAMRHVRVLVELERYNEASTQLQAITRHHPELADAWLILGSVQFELGQDKEAESSLLRYIALTKTTPNNTRGLIQAQTRRANLLARQGKFNEATQLLAQLPASNAEEARNLLLAQVQLLRDNRQWKAAFDLLAKHSKNDINLMYEQAMLAEKLNRMDEMERLLHTIISLDPDHYNAYNALGFSLADRHMRLPEAKQLILKALTFAPNDPFITDSLGWVEFRLGNLSEARAQLEKAYAAKVDAEIAAHLGEVLWHMNEHEQARAIWRKGLSTSPNNETLQETLQRLKPEL